MFQFAQHDSVAQVQIGRRRVHTEFYAKRTACLRGELQFRAQIFFADDFSRAAPDVRELLVHWRKFIRRAHFAADPAPRLRDAATTRLPSMRYSPESTRRTASV